MRPGGWLRGGANRLGAQPDNNRSDLTDALSQLAEARQAVEQLNFRVARLDVDLGKALATGERLQRELRMSEAEVRRLANELATRPAPPPASDGYWKRKWLEDRRNLVQLQDRLLEAEQRGQPHGSRGGLHVHRPEVIHLSRPPTTREFS